MTVQTEQGYPAPLPGEALQLDGIPGWPPFCPGCGIPALSQAQLEMMHKIGNYSKQNPNGERLWPFVHAYNVKLVMLRPMDVAGYCTSAACTVGPLHKPPCKLHRLLSSACSALCRLWRLPARSSDELPLTLLLQTRATSA